MFSLIPLTWKLAGAGILVAGVIGAGWYIHNAIEKAGYERAMDDVAKTNAVARVKLDEAVARVKSCRDFGGRWDQSRGVCANQQD